MHLMPVSMSDVAPKLFIATKAFIEHEGKVLIVRESTQYKDGTNPGKFDVPGGRLNPGERFDEALRREVKEETGLEVEIHEPIHVGEWRPVVREEPWQVVGVFFRVTCSSKEVTASVDHNELKWIDPAKYADEPMIANLTLAFEAYLKAKDSKTN